MWAPVAADDPGRVTVVADWAAGEKASYVEERIREVRQQEQVREQVRVRIPLTVEVLERLGDGYRLRLV